MNIRVFIADDHALVRDGLRLILGAAGDITVTGEAGNGGEVLRAVQEVQPDVVLMDVLMPEINGIELTGQLHASYPEMKILILSIYGTKEYIYRALRAGAAGYLLKESAGREVVKAVRAVHAGRSYFSTHVANHVLNELVEATEKREPKSPLETLSVRERQVLQLVVEGNTSAQIAQRMSLSPKSVETYRSRLMQKLHVSNLPELVKFAIRHGITAAS